jgi:hypothetical protein
MLLDVLRVRRRAWRGEYELDGTAAPIVIEEPAAEPLQAAA